MSGGEWLAVVAAIVGALLIGGAVGWTAREWALARESLVSNDAIRSRLLAIYARLRDGRNAANYPDRRYAEEDGV